MSGDHNANQKEVSMEPVATVSGSGVNWIQPQASRLKDRDCLYSAEQIAAKDDYRIGLSVVAESFLYGTILGGVVGYLLKMLVG